MAVQKRIWEGAYRYGQFLLFHDFTRGEDGRARYRDWLLYDLAGNEDIGYLQKPAGKILGRGKSLRDVKQQADSYQP